MLTQLELLMVLLPIVFMIHDFEEIIMFRLWIEKNREYLKQRFSKPYHYLSSHGYTEFSTATFSVGVLHEFILLSCFTFCGLYFNLPGLWIIGFMAYSIHILIHIAQWIVYRRYIPVIITSLLSLPYCIYTLILFLEAGLLSTFEIFAYSLIGFIAMILSIRSAYFLMSKFAQIEKRYLKNRKNEQE
ncbi:MAG: HXXEE domain-containing protein [Porphyromonas sp.]|nr:HXXEE domain-containing protein [Porphyromonas sp.]